MCIDGFVQGFGISIDNSTEILQSSTRPPMYTHDYSEYEHLDVNML